LKVKAQDIINKQVVGCLTLLVRSKKCLIVFLSIAIICSASASPLSPRETISQIYQKRYRAADILYFYGMRHGRTEDFTITGLVGDKLDYDLFLGESEEQMKRCVKAQWYGKIMLFEPISATSARCRVLEHFDSIIRNGSNSAHRVVSVATLSSDVWELRNGQWLQASSKILRSEQKETPFKESTTLSSLPTKSTSDWKDY
jgi:hypothetical protein